MIAKAKLKFVRVSPKKVNTVIRLLRGKKVEEARDILFNLNKAVSNLILSVLNSAISNSKDAISDLGDLYISRIVVNQGPTLKRFRACAFGRATVIRKRTSHIEIEINSKPIKETKVAAPSKERIKDRKSDVKKIKGAKSKIKKIVTVKRKRNSKN